MLILLKVPNENEESYWDTDDFKRIQRLERDGIGDLCCVMLKSGGSVYFRKNADELSKLVNKIRQS